VVIESTSHRVEKMKREEIVKEVGLVFQDPEDQLFMPTIFDDIAFGSIKLGI
jgi:cobalt/nickel transport system ATP-binding protein